MDTVLSVHVTAWLLALTCMTSLVHGDIDLVPDFYWEEDECPDDSSRFLGNQPAMYSTEDRAYRTLPLGLRIDDSSIPGIGLGVFTDVFIPAWTWLSEYEGEVILKLDHISNYAWKVKRSGRKYFYIDAHDESTSNWLRWINCSRHAREENVQVLECRGRMYYMTTRDVRPGEELLVYYGDGYAETLDIDTERYEDDDYYEEAIQLNGVTCPLNGNE